MQELEPLGRFLTVLTALSEEEDYSQSVTLKEC